MNRSTASWIGRVLILLVMIVVAGLGWWVSQPGGGESGVYGEVIHVSDGDSFVLRTGDANLTVRIYGIDAPELRQPHGDVSKAWMNRVIGGRSVRVVEQEKDQYGRLVGDVYVGEVNVGLESIREGMSWWYQYFAPGRTAYRDAEKEARESRVGLWRGEAVKPPWEFRRNNHKSR